MSTAAETIGHGASIEIPADIPTEKVWQALLLKMREPNLFVPATDIILRTSDDGLGIYREMTVGGKRLVENVYADEAKFEIRSEVVDGEVEHVNSIVTEETGERFVEFWKRPSRFAKPVTLQRGMSRTVSKSIGIEAIQKVLDVARTL